MKKIGLTMRVDAHKDVNEYRDAIDQRWYLFSRACNFLPVLLPNNSLSIEYLENLAGIILTGGNSLGSLGGNAIERDILEKQIIRYSTKSNLPIMGVCRGMQIIQNFFGVELEAIENHVAVRHDIYFDDNTVLNVNSYHNYGALKTVENLVAEARSADGIIEATRHRIYPILGIMWHPEREKQFCEFDIKLFRDHFKL